MIDKDLLDILVCPVSHTPLKLADAELLARVNRAIDGGRLVNSAGRKLEDRLEEALVRADGEVLYPVVDDIPVLLAEEAIALGSV